MAGWLASVENEVSVETRNFEKLIRRAALSYVQCPFSTVSFRPLLS